MRFSRSAQLEVEDLGCADYLTLEQRMFEVVEECEPGDEGRSTAEWMRLHAEEALRLARDVTSDDGG